MSYERKQPVLNTELCVRKAKEYSS